MPVPALEDYRAEWLKGGCKCSKPCGRQPAGAGECLYWYAIDHGPVTFGPCECVKGGKTYHARGVCLMCHGTKNSA